MADAKEALAQAVEDLRLRILADPAPSPAEVRDALDRIAAMALALWGEDRVDRP